MSEIRQRVLTTLLALIAAPFSLADVPIADVPPAEVPIDRLIQQANIVEGPTTVRDLPRYNGARKILIFDGYIELEKVADADAAVGLIIVPTLSEAMRYAGEVDAIMASMPYEEV